jgi:hypothetical protein
VIFGLGDLASIAHRKLALRSSWLLYTVGADELTYLPHPVIFDTPHSAAGR